MLLGRFTVGIVYDGRHVAAVGGGTFGIGHRFCDALTIRAFKQVMLRPVISKPAGVGGAARYANLSMNGANLSRRVGALLPDRLLHLADPLLDFPLNLLRRVSPFTAPAISLALPFTCLHFPGRNVSFP